MEIYNSLNTFDKYLQYGIDFIDDKVRYHPFWLEQYSGLGELQNEQVACRHNCYEGDDDFRSKLKEINRLGIYTYNSQPSELSYSSATMSIWTQYPFVSGIMYKNKAHTLLKIIDDAKLDNLIYVIDNKTNYDAQKHNNLLVFNGSVKVSYYSHDSNSETKGTWFTLNHNYINGNNTVINKLIPKLDANDYCFVQFMDNRIDDELFDNLIDLLKMI